MRLVLELALKSLANRALTAALTSFAVALSIFLLLGVGRLSEAARASFQSTVSGVDLIVGARGSPAQLLLYSVFHLGDATRDLSHDMVTSIAELEDVAFAVPLSLGDSHRGFRVIGTTADYFRHVRYGAKHKLTFAAGGPFTDLYDAVVGAAVARTLGYEVGAKIVIAHGTGEVSFLKHQDKPFRVVGVLAPTGTPIDRGVYVSLEAIEAIHVDWQTGAPPRPGAQVGAEEARALALVPRRVTAILLGVTSKVKIFAIQRRINEWAEEPAMAILPNVVILELWRLVGSLDRVLMLISGLVAAAGLLGMTAAILTALEERKREIAILRALGASPGRVFLLFASEALLLAGAGCILGVLALAGLTAAFAPGLGARFGIALPVELIRTGDLAILGAVLAGALLLGIIPALRAYVRALSDGLEMRL